MTDDRPGFEAPRSDDDRPADPPPNHGYRPYGAPPPGGPPPGAGQPPPWPPSQGRLPYAEQRSGGSIWVGIGLTMVVSYLTYVLIGRFGGTGLTVGGVLLLVGACVLIAREETRRIGAGMFIGFAILPILFAGACVLLLTSAIR